MKAWKSGVFFLTLLILVGCSNSDNRVSCVNETSKLELQFEVKEEQIIKQTLIMKLSTDQDHSDVEKALELEKQATKDITGAGMRYEIDGSEVKRTYEIDYDKVNIEDLIKHDTFHNMILLDDATGKFATMSETQKILEDAGMTCK